MSIDNQNFGVGDIVLVSRCQKTIFFEIIKVEENYAWVSDGWVQIKRTFNDIELICKAWNRRDKKVPFNKYVE
jgi:hypothetical protein